MAEKTDGLRERKCFKYIILFKFFFKVKGLKIYKVANMQLTSFTRLGCSIHQLTYFDIIILTIMVS